MIDTAIRFLVDDLNERFNQQDYRATLGQAIESKRSAAHIHLNLLGISPDSHARNASPGFRSSPINFSAGEFIALKMDLLFRFISPDGDYKKALSALSTVASYYNNHPIFSQAQRNFPDGIGKIEIAHAVVTREEEFSLLTNIGLDEPFLLYEVRLRGSNS